MGFGVTAPTTAESERVAVRLGLGVRWREYDDGIVVYVPATCETHILPPHFAAFFRASSARFFESPQSVHTLAGTSREVAISPNAGEFADELISLKIFDADN
jgi:hypothetical protein